MDKSVSTGEAYPFVKERGLSSRQLLVRVVRDDGATLDVANEVDGDEIERKIGAVYWVVSQNNTCFRVEKLDCEKGTMDSGCRCAELQQWLWRRQTRIFLSQTVARERL